jgi:hypothetical protein
MSLKSYSFIQNVSNQLFEELKSGNEVLSELENYGNSIAKNLCDDFYEIENQKLIIDKLFYYFEDDNYRQGATSCIVKTHFETEPNLLVNFECLIDHQKILLKIIGQPNNKIELTEIVNRIEDKYNSEGLTEFRTLKN